VTDRLPAKWRSPFAGRLSAKRRSPLAGLVVLLLALVVTGSLFALLSPADASSSGADAATVAKGRQLFLVGCSSCHGDNGEGVVTQDHTNYGPPLVGVGAAAVDFQVGTGRMPLARPGAQAEEKEPRYTPKEISELAAFVASLGPGPAIPTKQQYDISQATNENVVRGGQFFLTNCTACHNFAGAGGALPEGKYAPRLAGVTPKHIYEAMLTGPQQMPVFDDQVMTPQDKRDIISYLKRIQNQPSYGGNALGSLGPVSEGLWAWLVGIGSCVGVAIWIASKTARSSKGRKA
jgi:ubiquinol-cytochrome c reductase cytochrome c subunit